MTTILATHSFERRLIAHMYPIADISRNRIVDMPPLFVVAFTRDLALVHQGERILGSVHEVPDVVNRPFPCAHVKKLPDLHSLGLLGN